MPQLQRRSKLNVEFGVIAMNLLFNTTEDFATDGSNFDPLTRAQIAERVNLVAQAWMHDKETFAHYARQTNEVKLDNDYQSSLYAVQVEPNVSALLSIEDDPIFGQVVVTLLRVVESAQLDATYRALVEALYRDFGGKVVEAEVLVG